MEVLTKKNINCTTGEEIVIELATEEIAAHNAMLAKIKEDELAKEAAEVQRQAVLDRLGITSDEAKLLLS